MEFGKPVSLGVPGPGIYWSDVVREAGAEAYARMAVEAAVKMVKRMETLQSAKPSTYPLEVK
ncbi:MAG: hypothetical protein QXR06_05215 [Candidatus Bathyarchaeia archaeon]